MAPLHLASHSAATSGFCVVCWPNGGFFGSLVMMTPYLLCEGPLGLVYLCPMGWMLVECALGLYECALHLLPTPPTSAQVSLNAGNAGVNCLSRKRLVVYQDP